MGAQRQVGLLLEPVDDLDGSPLATVASGQSTGLVVDITVACRLRILVTHGVVHLVLLGALGHHLRERR